ncbi:MAG: metallophosphoesterase [Clostridia bacterium]|nr:metallophosphoesterase [Clostridia bacterium]
MAHMKFLVISDTHGKTAPLLRVLSRHADADAVLFLGDGLNEIEAAAAAGGLPPILAVRGNCDSPVSPYGCVREEELTVSLGGHRLLLSHGHTASVKSSPLGLVAMARRREADVVLYGHTHVARETYLGEEEGGPLWLLCPGSLGRPADGAPSFGLLTLDGSGSVLFSVGREG